MSTLDTIDSYLFSASSESYDPQMRFGLAFFLSFLFIYFFFIQSYANYITGIQEFHNQDIPIYGRYGILTSKLCMSTWFYMYWFTKVKEKYI